jgi:hypothetical protein
VVAGQAEIGIYPASEVAGVKGLTIVRPLPAEISLEIVYGAAATTNSEALNAASTFVKFMAAPENRTVWKYTMTFKEPPPFHEPAFWALRMFDATNSYPVPNPINRYVLGSDHPDMKKNADGSLTIYLQADDPGPDKEANWLPAPHGPFLLILGTYAPGEAMIKSLSDPKAYVPPAAVPVQ